MTNDSVAVKQLQSLQKKLENAIQSRALIEENLSQQSSLLLQFISKLSLVCKGMNLELDNKLASLRANLNKSSSFSDIEQQITSILTLLQQYTNKADADVRTLHQQFTQAGKGLQKTKGLPEKVRRELRNLLQNNQNSKDSLIQYLPLLSELLLIYDAALNNKSTVSQNGLLNQADTKTLSKVGSIDESFLANIEKILGRLKLSEHHQLQLISLKDEICHSKTLDDFQENLLEVFQVIAADLKQERDSAKSFLFSISKTLTTVQYAVSNTLQNTDNNHVEQSNLNQELQQQLGDISNTFDQAPSLNDVKDEINSKLQNLSELLQRKVEHENNSHAELEIELQQMSAHIQTLEQESKKFEVRFQEQLAKSMQDGLTKLNNRSAFDEHFAKEMVRYHHKAFDLAIVVLDLDDFKKINDTYGHAAGDKTIQVIANTLKKQLQNDAFIARYGGEEFVLVFSDQNKTLLLNKLETVKNKIARLPFKFKNNRVSITISVGITHVNSQDNVHLAFERADQALYQAKKQGKNRVVYA